MKYLLPVLCALKLNVCIAQSARNSLSREASHTLDSLQHNLPEYMDMKAKVAEIHNIGIFCRYLYMYTDSADTSDAALGTVVKYEFGYTKYRKYTHAWNRNKPVHILLHVDCSLPGGKVLSITKTRRWKRIAGRW